MSPEFDLPDNDARIWRYMDFAKFVAMLERGGLYFSRADLLRDPFEGSYTPESLQAFEALLRDKDIQPSKAEQWREILKSLRHNTYICCWHENEAESAALWRLYGEAIAIQSTVGRLRAFLPENQYDVGRVRYIDYEFEYPSIRYSTGAFFYKRREFAHERELRAVKQIHTYQGSEMVPHEGPGFPGKYQDGDLAGLIECVYVAPTSPGWFRELVFSVARKYGVDVSCRPSNLNVRPFV